MKYDNDIVNVNRASQRARGSLVLTSSVKLTTMLPHYSPAFCGWSSLLMSRANLKKGIFNYIFTELLLGCAVCCVHNPIA